MPSKTQSILVAAVVGAVLAVLTQFLASSGGGVQYVGSALGCISIIAVPMLAVWHYTNTHQLTLNAGSGAGLGAMASIASGLLGYIVAFGLQAVGVLPTQEEMIASQRETMLSQGMSAEEIEMAMGFATAMSGPIGIVVGIVIAAVVGAIVGAIGASVFKKGTADDAL
ncbi:MAG: hypothetical protein Rubg2KO_20410 [Rubricoccaceae bacterium]